MFAEFFFVDLNNYLINVDLQEANCTIYQLKRFLGLDGKVPAYNDVYKWKLNELKRKKPSLFK